ncbi:MAG: serine/threonine protein kinase [Bacilli bacterium]|nr:serine/threonine protein kinase [Bacilli bacterium]
MIEIGSKIDGRYRVTSRIGHGGMADVYEGFDTVSHRIIAIKIMRQDVMDNPKNVQRFQKECVASASLNSPYVVKVYGQGKVEGRPYMINEYVDGRTLRDKLNVAVSHNLDPYEACEVMVQLCLGLQYVHDHGIIHRDIKPDNLFYLPDGSIKISDFGISSHIGEKATSDSIPGTIYYTAPEILRGNNPCIQSDIFSMGVLFFEILTGAVPFDGKETKDIVTSIVKKNTPLASDIYQTIPKALDRIIVKALRKRPEERFQNANQFKRALENVMKDKKAFKVKRSWIARFFGFK